MSILLQVVSGMACSTSANAMAYKATVREPQWFALLLTVLDETSSHTCCTLRPSPETDESESPTKKQRPSPARAAAAADPPTACSSIAAPSSQTYGLRPRRLQLAAGGSTSSSSSGSSSNCSTATEVVVGPKPGRNDHVGGSTAAAVGSGRSIGTQGKPAAGGGAGGKGSSKAVPRGATARSIPQQEQEDAEPKKGGRVQRSIEQVSEASGEGNRGREAQEGLSAKEGRLPAAAEAGGCRLGRGQRQVKQVVLSSVFRQCKPGRGAAVTAAAAAVWDQKEGKAGAAAARGAGGKGTAGQATAGKQQEQHCHV